MIEVKCLLVRALRWINDFLRCLLELYDNLILFIGKEREGERESREKNSDFVVLFEVELN